MSSMLKLNPKTKIKSECHQAQTYLPGPDIARRRTHNVVDLYKLQSLNQEPVINCSVTICPCGFMNKPALQFERSPLINSYGYPCQIYRGAGDRPSGLLVTSMRLTPCGACAINLFRRCIARLPLKSEFFMQYPG